MKNSNISIENLSDEDIKAFLITNMDSYLFAFLMKRFGFSFFDVVNIPSFNRSAGSVYNWIHGFYKMPVKYAAIIINDLFIKHGGIESLKFLYREYKNEQP